MTSAGCSRHLPSRLDGRRNANIDRIGQEGAIFMDYVAVQAAPRAQYLLHGMYPLRRHDAATAGSPWPAARDACSPSSDRSRLPPASSAEPGAHRACQQHTAGNTGATSTISTPCSG
jgi:hypothetical protein